MGISNALSLLWFKPTVERHDDISKFVDLEYRREPDYRREEIKWLLRSGQSSGLPIQNLD